MKRALARGFSLIELMIAVAIIGILTAIVLPMYGEYVTRSRLTEAFSALSVAQTSAEQFWSNNRTYNGFGTASNFPAATPNFTYAISGDTTSAYLITATGRVGAANFAFTINQGGAKTTTAVPTGWTRNAACWTDHKAGTCTQ